MTHHNHGDHNKHHHDNQHHGSKRSGLHKDWRAWAIVLLMLGAMAIYLLTMDESLVPGNPPGQIMPADAPPPAAP